MLESILAMEVDSTAELPSEPDPGSVGSSSCVSNFARYMSVRSTFVVLTESSNFNTATPHGPSLRDELSGSEGETGESMECVLHRRRRAVCKGAACAFKGLDHARCQTVEYGVFVHPLVLSSGARHGPRIARPHGVTVLKLELSASTTTQAPAAMGAEGLITQEELPAEPDSGSEGSSTPLCPPWRPAGARPRSSLSPR